MKNGVAILVSFLLAGTGIQVSIDRHYCGGKIADVKVSLSGKAASCGMEEDQPFLTDYLIIKAKCCEDENIVVSISNNYYPEYRNIITDDPEKIINKVHANNINSYYIPEHYSVKFIHPPGNKPGPPLKQSEICVYRI